ncbi:MAG: PKD domain-containing protein [Thermoplasmata archaeon]|nr:PKD domain-containing protein [Thermoplasmata archaeon]
MSAQYKLTHPGKASTAVRRGCTAGLIPLSIVMIVGIFIAAGTICGPCYSGQEDVRRGSTLSLQDTLDPIADAGIYDDILTGAIVELNGSGSTDNIGVVNCTWTIDDGETTIVLEGEVVDHVFSEAGTYTITLNTSDAEGNWDMDSTTITVEEDTELPIPATTPRKAEVGTLVKFNASLSSDNVRIVNYTWTFIYDDEEVELYGVAPSFWFNRTGQYDVTLNVTDASGLWDSTVFIVDIEKAPTWLSENWLKFLVTALTVGGATYYLISKYRRDKALITSADRDKLNLRMKEARKTWKIFRSNRLGFGGSIILVIFLVIALFAPWLSVIESPNLYDNHEPNLREPDGTWIQRNPLPPSLSPSDYMGIIHPLGTDYIGQDVWSMTIYGTRASLIVGFVATAISALLGAAIGLGAGYFGKAADEVLMRVTDFFLVLPWFPLMIVMMAILGRDFIWIIVVIGITSWPSTARIVRAQVLTVKERQFIERARAIGAGDRHIISKHIMPNVMPLIFANTVLLISLAIFSESFLSFFGLGDPSVISWGTMLVGAYNYGAFYQGSWWTILPPGLAILTLVLSFSLVGYALDDVLNPKL